MPLQRLQEAAEAGATVVIPPSEPLSRPLLEAKQAAAQANAQAEVAKAQAKAAAAKATGPLPGGYAVGEKVFYAGGCHTFASGDKLTHGQAGEVKGPATAASHVDKGVAVMFPGNKGSVICPLTLLSRSAPPPAAGAQAV